MVLHLRKRVAQAGVILFIASLLAPVFLAPISALGGGMGLEVVAFFPLVVFSGMLLFIATLIPGTKGETWGSMWPLVGYDNAIDSLYVRGPWWQRFEELDDMEAEKRTTTAMSGWFN